MERRGDDTVLQSEADLMAAILDGIGDGYYAIDRDWRITFFNKAAEDFFGLPRSSILGRPLWDIFPSAMGTGNMRMMTKTMETGEPCSFKGKSVVQDDRYVEARIFPIREGIGVAFSDITERKAAEDAVRAARAQAEAAADEREAVLGQLAEGVIIADAQGRINFVNEAARRMHGVTHLGVDPAGYSTAYNLFTDAGDPYPPSELPLARAVATGETVQEERWRIRRPDGSEITAVGSARRVLSHDGEVLGAVLTLRDDTARIMAERALQESEKRFRTLADSAPALIWMSDAHGQVTFANHYYEEFFGRPSQDMQGAGWREVVHRDDVGMFADAYYEAIAARRSLTIDVRVHHRDGNPRWLRCQCVPRFDGASNFLGFTGCNVDITDAKLAEERLRAALGDLENEVCERTQEAKSALEQLFEAQKMETIGQLTGGIAHDFNNLLMAILGNLSMLKKRLPDGDRAHRLLDNAILGAERGASLTQRLLAFARRQELRPEAVPLACLLDGIEDLLRRSLGSQISLTFDLADETSPVLVDPHQLELAILNLAVNARDAMPGGGALRISARNDDADGRPAALGPGRYVRLSVRDEGVGMDEATLARAREPFFTTKGVGKGTGLGLSMVHGLALQSGGLLHIESRPGEGTTVEIWLQATEGEAEGTAAQRVDATPAEQPPVTVLLVDDDALVAFGTASMLEDLGHVVIEANSGAKALGLLEAHPAIDLLITDFAMPGMNGREL
ncbi:MAG TPA: PAS domain S-box protein, partial [Saliniramus sp.]|nr:PAS domain S-box protein [Saliniramus sp.]